MYSQDIPDKCQLYAQIRVDNAALAMTNGRLREHTRARLRHILADRLVHEKVREVPHEWHTDFIAELFVLTPDELGKIIREEASRIARFMTPLNIS